MVCITKEDDFRKDETVARVVSLLRTSRDAVWFSCPCTGGSAWQRVNAIKSQQTRDKIQAHWKLFRQLWRSFSIVAARVFEIEARLFVEWPRGVLIGMRKK